MSQIQATELKNLTEAQIVSKIGPLFTEDQKKSGILAAISMAQFILESGYGKTDLAQNANNCFGMKKSPSGNTWGGSTWDGKSIYTKRTSEEYTKGNITAITADFRKYSCIEDSIGDHSAYLNGALNGSTLRYAGLKGETNYKIAAQLIKNSGYATDSAYVSKLCNIIERWNLTQYNYTNNTIEKEKIKMNITKAILTKNSCYTGGRKLSNGVQGLMLHSIGCPQPRASVFVNSWNSPSYDSACVHGFIDALTGEVFQTLPWDWRGWHCGSGPNGSGNNTHIGVEMCEPANINYTGGSAFTCNDVEAARACVRRTYNSAVQLFAYLCQQYKLNPLKDGVILSHREGHARGIASNHGDPEHLWNGLQLGYTMNTFRQAVAAAMGNVSAAESNGAPTPSNMDTVKNFPKTPFTVDVLINDLNYRSEGSMSGIIQGMTGKGKFTITEVNSSGWGKLKSGAGWIYLGNPAYVKIGTTVAGANTSATTNSKNFIVRVDIDDLRIRTGAGTNYSWTGKYTGVGTFTIVETKNGWGKLKSGAGWISLSYCTRI